MVNDDIIMNFRHWKIKNFWNIQKRDLNLHNVRLATYNFYVNRTKFRNMVVHNVDDAKSLAVCFDVVLWPFSISFNNREI